LTESSILLTSFGSAPQRRQVRASACFPAFFSLLTDVMAAPRREHHLLRPAGSLS
jgi:hypothetical protein